MPFQTFFNLPDEKKYRILNAAVTEFAEHGYLSSSIYSIASKAGISKGSMYQYFENKMELYIFVVNHSITMVIGFLSKVIKENKPLPFFEMLEGSLIRGIEYIKSNPDVYKIYENIRQDIPLDEQMYVSKRIPLYRHSCCTEYLRNAVEKGELRGDLEVHLAAFVVYTLLNEFGRYIRQMLKCRNDNEIKDQIKQFIAVLKDGLKGVK